MENQTTTSEKAEEKKAEEPTSTINWGAMALAALAGGALGYLLSSQSSKKETAVNDDLEIDDSDRVERWQLQKQKHEKKMKEEKSIAAEKQATEINRQSHQLQKEKLNKKVERKIATPQKKSSTYIQIK
ncbi:MAG: hypothetical protein RJA07_2800 [Bacteroidota bacterium]|jgi:uncharacterized protein HemX